MYECRKVKKVLGNKIGLRVILEQCEGLMTEEFLSPRNWASALQKTMEGERQHLSPHIGDFNDDSKTKISQNGLKYFIRNKQSRLFAKP